MGVWNATRFGRRNATLGSMAGSVKVTINSAAVVSIVGPITKGTAQRGAQAAVRYARQNIKAAGRVHTGEMGAGMRAEPSHSSSSMESVYRVVPGGDGYAKYQEFGTRAHGPVRAKRLVFQIRGKGPLIFAKWVRGVTPAHFMRNAMNALTPNDFIR
jgi:hypothetical protein